MTKEREELILNNYDLVFKALDRYDLDKEEYEDLAAIGLCRAAILYKPRCGRFETFALKTICNELLKGAKELMATEDCEPEMISLNEPMLDYECELGDCVPGGTNIEKFILQSEDYEEFKSRLTTRSLRVLNYLQQGYSQSEIARMENISRMRVMQIRNYIANKAVFVYSGSLSKYNSV